MRAKPTCVHRDPLSRPPHRKAIEPKAKMSSLHFHLSTADPPHCGCSSADSYNIFNISYVVCVPAHGCTKSARGSFDFGGAHMRKCLGANVICKRVQVCVQACASVSKCEQVWARVCKCVQACGSVQAWCAKREWSQNAPRCTFVWTSQKRRKMHVE